MKKSIIKVVAILLICFTMFGIVDTAYAGGVYRSAGAFDNGSMPTKVSTMLNSMASNVITIIRIVGVAVAMGILLIIAMKYMSAAPSEKADIKKYAINYTIAAVIIFGASQLIAIIASLAKVVTQ